MLLRANSRKFFVAPRIRHLNFITLITFAVSYTERKGGRQRQNTK